MTKSQALKSFRAHVAPAVREQYGRHDNPAIREAWVTWIDDLARSGQITDRQVRTWDNPF
jgi:hypothetical protein